MVVGGAGEDVGAIRDLPLTWLVLVVAAVIMVER